MPYITHIHFKELSDDVFKPVAKDALWRRGRKRVSRERIEEQVDQMAASGKKSWKDLIDAYDNFD